VLYLSEEDTFDDMDPAQLIEQAEEAKAAGENEIAAKLYNAAGNIYMSVAEYEEAKDSFEHALNLYQEIGDEIGISDSMYNLGVAQINLEQWDAAAKTCQNAMALFEKNSNPEGTADALYGIALAKVGLGQFDEAMEFFKKAQKAYKDINNEQGVVSIIMDIGNAHADREEWELAEAQFKKALKIYRDIDDKAGIADALSLLGDIAEMNNNQRKSAEYFVEAAECYLAAEIFDIAREVVDRAEQKMWDLPKATRRRLRKALDDIIDALPEEPEEDEDEGDDGDFDEDLLEFQ
jgi:tetratricopeptide (TPR) repeat protein